MLQAVWPDTIVEEVNLAKSISALRKVLGEDRRKPKYIETIPKRGYRFIASVREVVGQGADLVLSQQTQLQLVIEEEEYESENGAVGEGGNGTVEPWEKGRAGEVKTLPLPALRWWQRSYVWGWLAVGLLVLIGGGLWVYLSPSHSSAIMTVVPFTSYPGQERYPALSPDGRQLAFS